jgi:hypothetical protein
LSLRAKRGNPDDRLTNTHGEIASSFLLAMTTLFCHFSFRISRNFTTQYDALFFAKIDEIAKSAKSKKSAKISGSFVAL